MKFLRFSAVLMLVFGAFFNAAFAVDCNVSITFNAGSATNAMISPNCDSLSYPGIAGNPLNGKCLPTSDCAFTGYYYNDIQYYDAAGNFVNEDPWTQLCDKQNVELTAGWNCNGDCLAVTFDHNGGEFETAGASDPTLYTKIGTPGFFTDSNCNTLYTGTPRPATLVYTNNSNAEFKGYYETRSRQFIFNGWLSFGGSNFVPQSNGIILRAYWMCTDTHTACPGTDAIDGYALYCGPEPGVELTGDDTWLISGSDTDAPYLGPGFSDEADFREFCCRLGTKQLCCESEDEVVAGWDIIPDDNAGTPVQNQVSYTNLFPITFGDADYWGANNATVTRIKAHCVVPTTCHAVVFDNNGGDSVNASTVYYRKNGEYEWYKTSDCKTSLTAAEIQILKPTNGTETFYGYYTQAGTYNGNPAGQVFKSETSQMGTGEYLDQNADFVGAWDVTGWPATITLKARWNTELEMTVQCDETGNQSGTVSLPNSDENLYKQIEKFIGENNCLQCANNGAATITGWHFTPANGVTVPDDIKNKIERDIRFFQSEDDNISQYSEYLDGATIYPIYECSYTATYECGDHGSYDDGTGHKSGSYTDPTEPVAGESYTVLNFGLPNVPCIADTGYVFNGWVSNETLSPVYNQNSSDIINSWPNQNITFTAQYTCDTGYESDGNGNCVDEQYSVTFVCTGENNVAQTANPQLVWQMDLNETRQLPGLTDDNPPCTIKTEYENWYDSTSLEWAWTIPDTVPDGYYAVCGSGAHNPAGTSFTFNCPTDRTIYGTVGLKGKTITYDCNGVGNGSAPGNQTVTYENRNSVTIANATSCNAGGEYVFNGWAVADDGAINNTNLTNNILSAGTYTNLDWTNVNTAQLTASWGCAQGYTMQGGTCVEPGTMYLACADGGNPISITATAGDSVNQLFSTAFTENCVNYEYCPNNGTFVPTGIRVTSSTGTLPTVLSAAVDGNGMLSVDFLENNQGLTYDSTWNGVTWTIVGECHYDAEYECGDHGHSTNTGGDSSKSSVSSYSEKPAAGGQYAVLTFAAANCAADTGYVFDGWKSDYPSPDTIYGRNETSVINSYPQRGVTFTAQYTCDTDYEDDGNGGCRAKAGSNEITITLNAEGKRTSCPEWWTVVEPSGSGGDNKCRCLAWNGATLNSNGSNCTRYDFSGSTQLTVNKQNNIITYDDQSGGQLPISTDEGALWMPQRFLVVRYNMNCPSGQPGDAPGDAQAKWGYKAYYGDSGYNTDPYTYAHSTETNGNTRLSDEGYNAAMDYQDSTTWYLKWDLGYAPIQLPDDNITCAGYVFDYWSESDDNNASPVQQCNYDTTENGDSQYGYLPSKCVSQFTNPNAQNCTATTNYASDDCTDTTLYAHWTPGVFEVKLNAPDATVQGLVGFIYERYREGWARNQNSTNWTQITLSGNELPSRTGYTLLGYGRNGQEGVDIVAAVNQDGSWTTPSSTTVISNENWYARWAEAQSTTYTVTYNCGAQGSNTTGFTNSNTATVGQSYKVAYTDNTPIADCTPNTGYVFDKWLFNYNNNTYSSGYTIQQFPDVSTTPSFTATYTCAEGYTNSGTPENPVCEEQFHFICRPIDYVLNSAATLLNIQPSDIETSLDSIYTSTSYDYSSEVSTDNTFTAPMLLNNNGEYTCDLTQAVKETGWFNSPFSWHMGGSNYWEISLNYVTGHGYTVTYVPEAVAPHTNTATNQSMTYQQLAQNQNHTFRSRYSQTNGTAMYKCSTDEDNPTMSDTNRYYTVSFSQRTDYAVRDSDQICEEPMHVGSRGFLGWHAIQNVRQSDPNHVENYLSSNHQNLNNVNPNENDGLFVAGSLVGQHGITAFPPREVYFVAVWDCEDDYSYDIESGQCVQDISVTYMCYAGDTNTEHHKPDIVNTTSYTVKGFVSGLANFPEMCSINNDNLNKWYFSGDSQLYAPSNTIEDWSYGNGKTFVPGYTATFECGSCFPNAPQHTIYVALGDTINLPTVAQICGTQIAQQCQGQVDVSLGWKTRYESNMTTPVPGAVCNQTPAGQYVDANPSFAWNCPTDLTFKPIGDFHNNPVTYELCCPTDSTICHTYTGNGESVENYATGPQFQTFLAQYCPTSPCQNDGDPAWLGWYVSGGLPQNIQNDMINNPLQIPESMLPYNYNGFSNINFDSHYNVQIRAITACFYDVTYDCANLGGNITRVDSYNSGWPNNPTDEWPGGAAVRRGNWDNLGGAPYVTRDINWAGCNPQSGYIFNGWDFSTEQTESFHPTNNNHFVPANSPYNAGDEHPWPSYLFTGVNSLGESSTRHEGYPGTFTANWVWDQNGGQCHTVTFDDNNGDPVLANPVRYMRANQVGWYNSDCSEVTNDGDVNIPNKAGSRFTGYKQQGTSTMVFNGNGSMMDPDWTISSNVTLVAQWNCSETQFYDATTGLCTNCPTGFPYADAGATSAAQCYRTCQDTCNQVGCPVDDCTYINTDVPIDGRIYNDGTNTCVVGNCDYTIDSCPPGQYINGDTCESCPTGFTSGAGADDITDCYKTCTADCIQSGCDSETLYAHDPNASVSSCQYTTSTLSGEQHCNAANNGTCIDVSACSAASVECPYTYDCKPLYHHNPETGLCESCVDGEYWDVDDELCKSCNLMIHDNHNWTTRPPHNTSIDHCYRLCENVTCQTASIDVQNINDVEQFLTNPGGQVSFYGNEQQGLDVCNRNPEVPYCPVILFGRGTSISNEQHAVKPMHLKVNFYDGLEGTHLAGERYIVGPRNSNDILVNGRYGWSQIMGYGQLNTNRRYPMVMYPSFLAPEATPVTGLGFIGYYDRQNSQPGPWTVQYTDAGRALNTGNASLVVERQGGDPTITHKLYARYLECESPNFPDPETGECGWCPEGYTDNPDATSFEECYGYDSCGNGNCNVNCPTGEHIICVPTIVQVPWVQYANNPGVCVPSADCVNTITCDSGYYWNGTSCVPESQYVIHLDYSVDDTNHLLETNPRRNLYTIHNTGVYLDSGRTQQMSTNNNPIEEPHKYINVTLNAMGGTVQDWGSEPGGVVTDRIYFKFKGFYRNQDTVTNGDKFIELRDQYGYITNDGSNAGKSYNADTTWYAHWYSTSIDLPSAERDGYQFLGWFTENGTTPMSMPVRPNDDITYYAHWTKCDPGQIVINGVCTNCSCNHGSDVNSCDASAAATGNACVATGQCAPQYGNFTSSCDGAVCNASCSLCDLGANQISVNNECVTCECTNSESASCGTLSNTGDQCNWSMECMPGYVNLNPNCTGPGNTTCNPTCTPCPAGYISQGNTCVPCESGFYQNADTNTCDPCGVGYTSSSGSTQCYPVESYAVYNCGTGEGNAPYAPDGYPMTYNTMHTVLGNNAPNACHRNNSTFACWRFEGAGNQGLYMPGQQILWAYTTNQNFTAVYCANCQTIAHGTNQLNVTEQCGCECTLTCDTGYHVDASTHTCEPNVYPDGEGITYQPNGGTPNISYTQTVTYDATFDTKGAVYTKYRNVLDWWHVVSGGDGTFENGRAELSQSYVYRTDGSTTLEAHWTECAPGWISLNNVCHECEENTYQDGDECKPCESGYVSVAGSTECEPVKSNAKYACNCPGNSGATGTAPADQSMAYGATHIVRANSGDGTSRGCEKTNSTFMGWLFNNVIYNAGDQVLWNYTTDQTFCAKYCSDCPAIENGTNELVFESGECQCVQHCNYGYYADAGICKPIKNLKLIYRPNGGRPNQEYQRTIENFNDPFRTLGAVYTKDDNIMTHWDVVGGSTNTFTAGQAELGRDYAHYLDATDTTLDAHWESCQCNYGENDGVASCSTPISNNSCGYEITCKPGYVNPHTENCDGTGNLHCNAKCDKCPNNSISIDNECVTCECTNSESASCGTLSIAENICDWPMACMPGYVNLNPNCNDTGTVCTPQCTQCGIGTYQDGDTCVDCPEGYTTAYPGSTSVDDCNVPKKYYLHYQSEYGRNRTHDQEVTYNAGFTTAKASDAGFAYDNHIITLWDVVGRPTNTFAAGYAEVGQGYNAYIDTADTTLKARWEECQCLFGEDDGVASCNISAGDECSYVVSCKPGYINPQTADCGGTGNLHCNAKCEPCPAGTYQAGDHCEACDPCMTSLPGAASINECYLTCCPTGQHIEHGDCVDNEKTCSAPDATDAVRVWNDTLKAYGACIVRECRDGYHISDNACVVDDETCTVANGHGEREWNSITNQWGTCFVTTCDAGYEINADGTGCVECWNRRVNGEIAVSGYIYGCEIATCMYQGQKYALEMNECVPICSADRYDPNDQSGTITWDERTKKCVRTCNPGYKMW